jgi:uncharacterized membrane protein
MSYQFAQQPQFSNQTSTFGLSPNGAALLSYIWIPVTSIVVLATEKKNRHARFHAFQSLFLGMVLIALTFTLSIVMGILMFVAGSISPYAGIIVSLASLLVWLVISAALLAIWIRCLMKAYRGEQNKLPFIGKTAWRMANK